MGRTGGHCLVHKTLTDPTDAILSLRACQGELYFQTPWDGVEHKLSDNSMAHDYELRQERGKHMRKAYYVVIKGETPGLFC